jgi:hypothetical protein
MRSRCDAIALGPTVARARARGLCGFGGVLQPPPADVDDAIELAAQQYDDRLARRIARFAAVPMGSLVWTRDDDDLFWLGRLTGSWRYDSAAAAAAVDLVHVRPCRWLRDPITESDVPTAVIATFGRGGRNFQQTHGALVGPQTEQVWRRRFPGRPSELPG